MRRKENWIKGLKSNQQEVEVAIWRWWLAAVKNFHWVWLRRNKLVCLGDLSWISGRTADCECQELRFSGSKGGFWDVPVLGVFFSLKQETVGVVFCRPVDRLDGLLRLRRCHVAERRVEHSCFHSVLASGWLPAQSLKEQLSLSLSVPPLDQSLGVYCGFQPLST